jgi:TonB-dependent starch-binding outer membrane protein SusC
MKYGYTITIFMLSALLLGLDQLVAQDKEQSHHPHHKSDIISVLLSTQATSAETFSFEFEDTPLNEVLRRIADRGQLKILTNSSLIPDNHTITAEYRDIGLLEAFYRVLEETGLDFILSGNGYVIIVPRVETEEEPEQQETITGQVIDEETGEALPGVNILIEGTTTGTATDADGRFELSVSSLDETLIITYIGYQRQEVSIEGRSDIVLTLQPDIIAGD